jgi:hypothetical protein
VRVATIVLASAPTGTSKYVTWGLAQGTNSVWLTLVNGEWRAQFVPGTAAPTTQTKYKVAREPHSMAVPLTARWVWNDLDEDIWVSCDQGCCTISDRT